MKIAIIGAGIGGLTTALALRQLGFEPQVFEQAPQLLEVGAAIALWPNALRVLDRLGIGQTIIANSGVIEGVRWASSTGQVLNKVQLPNQEVPAVALHRADLQAALLTALPEHSIHLGRSFTRYEQQGKQMELSFVDAPSVACDVLIGADGLHSDVRNQFLGDGEPINRGYTVWRGVTDLSLSELTPNTAIELYGRGQRFGIGPVGRGRVGWWASANTNGNPEPGEQEKLLSLFADWWAPVRKLIESTPSLKILCNVASDRSRPKQWGSGPMTLLGDAIHPTTPNLGQGGCMAIEDAVVLARCLERYVRPGEGLRIYERIRSSRTAALARYSRLYGTIGQWENGTAVFLRRNLIPLLPEYLIQRALRLIFEYDAYAVAIP